MELDKIPALLLWLFLGSFGGIINFKTPLSQFFGLLAILAF